MKNLAIYDLSIQEIKKNGANTYEYIIGKSFFKEFDYEDFKDASLNIHFLIVNEHSKHEFKIQIEGCLKVHCDLSYDLFELPIKNTTEYIVKFEEEPEDNEGIIYISPGTSKVNIAHYLYESILLSVPMKIIHPDIVNGIRKKPNFTTLNNFEDLKLNLEKEAEKNDPRWDQLIKLIDKK